MYSIRMGVPEMAALWNSLQTKVRSSCASADEQRLYKRIGKALALLSHDPRHPGLHSHEIAALTKRYGRKVWESYLENQAPSAGRIFWVYGPQQDDITVIAIEPHPNDKANAYRKITLSSLNK